MLSLKNSPKPGEIFSFLRSERSDFNQIEHLCICGFFFFLILFIILILLQNKFSTTQNKINTFACTIFHKYQLFYSGLENVTYK